MPRVLRLVDDAPARGERRREPRLDVLARDRHIDVHRVPQWLGLIELLHPDCRSVAERIDRIIVGHGVIAEHSAPEADVHRLGLRGDRELYLLDGRAIGEGAVRSCDRRDRPRQLGTR